MFVVWIPIALFELLVLALAVKVGLTYFHSIRPFGSSTVRIVGNLWPMCYYGIALLFL
jgi:hypothetical protein